MITTGISQIYSNTTTKTGDSVLDKDDFLTLLVTQLMNQDPLNPMDNTEFTAQLTQFSSLEELQNVNTNLEMLKLSQQAIHNTQALEMIGRNIAASGDSVTLADGTADIFYYEIEDDAADVNIYLYDSAGNLVFSEALGEVSAGLYSYLWDGTDTEGAAVADGTYTAVIMAADAEGNNLDTDIYVLGTVAGVVFEGGSPQLVIGDRQVDFNEINEVAAAVASAQKTE